jgi:hypothetical protein
MTPKELTTNLNTLIESGKKIPAFIWGPPGVGKSAIVAAVAAQHGLEVVDLRLGQIPPSDLRGLPYVKDGVSCYARPEWLRPEGRGVLFLDELPNAVPTVQGLSQQLLLDRRIGEHKLGDGWFIIGAGNRREHGAAVHAMPSPVANRMVHFDLDADLDSWKAFALRQGLHPDVVGFVSFRPELLFSLDRRQAAYPTPRSWEMASALHGMGMSVRPSVGEAAGDEFKVYCDIVADLPDLGCILGGNGDDVDFPKEMSARYAVCVGLAMRCADENEALRAFEWLDTRSGPEWLQMYIADAMIRLQTQGRFGPFAAMVDQNERLGSFVAEVLREVVA